MRTNTIVKGCIVSIDATPFKAWFEKQYSCKIGAKGEVTKDDLSKLEGVSKSNLAKLQKLQDSLQEQKEVIEQLASGKILARISSRPGQCGRADGYILEDEELRGARKVLSAAALTYVAALIVSLANLLRLILLFGGRRDD